MTVCLHPWNACLMTCGVLGNGLFPRAFPERVILKEFGLFSSAGVSYKLQGLLVCHTLQTWIDN